MSQNFGIKICCCRVCTCINFGFITSKAGLLKLIQLGLATLCDGLLLKYGIPAADTIGQALTGFLTTTSYCFTTTAILLACYCFSDKSYSLIRQSLFVSFKEFIWIQHFHWKKYNIEESQVSERHLISTLEFKIILRNSSILMFRRLRI